ncbi:MAG: calcium-binding protein [Paracoccaceae bacterium]
MSHNVMMIGHSLVGSTLPGMVSQLLNATSPGSDVDRQVINGAPLIYNWDHSANAEGTDARAALPTGQYTALVMTEAIPLATHLQWSDTHGHARKFDQLAMNANAATEVMIYETWHEIGNEAVWRNGLDSDLALWQGIVDHLNAGRAAGQAAATLLPAGQAMGRLYDTIARGDGMGLTSIRDVFSDNIHLKESGNYLTSLVHYSAIAGLSGIGLPSVVYNPFGIAYTGWTDAQARLFQHLAWEAVALTPGARQIDPELLPALILDGPGNDTQTGGTGDDRIYGGIGADRQLGGAGSDLIDGGGDNDFQAGQSGDDWIIGGDGADRLSGASGADFLTGDAGNDRLTGGADADTLGGGTGRDVLAGNTGDDLLTGGADADRFVFVNGDDRDRVTDFSLADGDKLHLSDALWAGVLTEAQVVGRFASVTGAGVTFDFGDGYTVTLAGLTSLQGLADALLI